MIEDPGPNFITRPYRGLSVQQADVELAEPALKSWLIGREVYRRTDFLLLEHAEQWALVAIQKDSPELLFSPVVDMRLLAGPAHVRMITSPKTDVGNASALAAAAAAHHEPGILAYAVRGRFEHINFIWRPDPFVVRVTEVVPPRPAKLMAMARQAVAFDEDLPALRLEVDEVDLAALTEAHPADHYLLPCRGSGITSTKDISFLDTRPRTRRDWLMLGCERSAQFHAHFFGDQPSRVDLCPRNRARTETGVLTLSKCCLLERGVHIDGPVAVVPWGANLDEVRIALRRLLHVANPEAPRVDRLIDSKAASGS